MRQIGTLPNSKDASRFAAYLLTQGIAAQSEEESGAWAVWVRDEDQLASAKAALAEFRVNPNESKFQGVEQAAEERRRAEASKREAAKQNVVTMGQRWRAPGGGRRRPLTLVMLFLCSAIGVMTSMGLEFDSPVYEWLRFSTSDRVVSGAKSTELSQKLADVKRGQVWRIVTPVFVHYGPYHLAFNLVMFYQIASAIEHRRGSLRLALLMLAIAIPSNLAQALLPDEWGGAVLFGGLSGVVFGLLGYLWMKSRFDPGSGMYINRGSVLTAFIFLCLGIAGVFDIENVRIANWAHTVGFVTGIVIGYAPIAWRSISKE